MRSKSVLLVAVFSVLVTTRTHATVPYYQVTDLDPLGRGRSSAASEINNNGQIIGNLGSGWEGTTSYRAVLFDATGHGNNTPLALLPGGAASLAQSINDQGKIVGTVYYGGSSYMGVRWDPAPQELGGLGGNASSAYSINNNGQIVGQATNGSGDWLAARFDPLDHTKNSNLGTVPGGRQGLATATSVNEAGKIVGSALEGAGLRQAVLFDPANAENNILLGTVPGGYASEAMEINDNGQIVGWAKLGTPREGEADATVRAARFDPTGNGHNIDLGTLGGYGSYAYSINNYDQIVGMSWNTATEFGNPADWRATLFDPTGGGHNIDLNTLIDPTLGWTLMAATSINDLGQIVGCGTLANGDIHAFLLTPTSPVPVPAPGALLLGGIGMGLVGCLRRRKTV